MKWLAQVLWFINVLVEWAGRQAGRIARLGLFTLGLVVVVMALPVAVNVLEDPWAYIVRGPEVVDDGVLGALGSILVGFAALFIGGRLRKHQEADAVARSRLALNVDLKTRVVPSGDEVALEVIVEVHNVSARTWFVPMVYLYVRAATGEARSLVIPKEDRNRANYGATLCKLQPLERDQFFACLPFDRSGAAAFPAVVVTAEVVGVSDRWFEPETRMMRFIDFMASENGFRHTFLCLRRCPDPRDPWYGDRCFVGQDFEIDRRATAAHRGLLHDMMLWTREAVVAIREPSDPREAGLEEPPHGPEAS